MIPGHIKEGAANKLRENFDKVQSGLDNAHKIALLEEGVKYQQTSVSPDQAQFLETRQFEVREMAAWLGLPPHKLGDTSNASYNSLEQENAAYLEDTLDPWLCAWEGEAWDKLLTEQEKDEESVFVEHDRSALLRTDLLSRYRGYAIGRQWGWESANSVLIAEGREPIGPQGDTYLSPSNMVSADDLGDLPEPAAAPIPARRRRSATRQEIMRASREAQKKRRAELVAAHRELLVDAGRRIVRRIATHATRA